MGVGDLGAEELHGLIDIQPVIRKGVSGGGACLEGFCPQHFAQQFVVQCVMPLQHPHGLAQEQIVLWIGFGKACDPFLNAGHHSGSRTVTQFHACAVAGAGFVLLKLFQQLGD